MLLPETDGNANGSRLSSVMAGVALRDRGIDPVSTTESCAQSMVYATSANPKLLAS